MTLNLRHLDRFRAGRNCDPKSYPFTITLPGLTTAHQWYPSVLAAIRMAANDLTEGDYGLFVTRDPRTHERTGYLIGANDAVVVARLRWKYVQFRFRAEQVRS